jgi:hypothetical protein
MKRFALSASIATCMVVGGMALPAAADQPGMSPQMPMYHRTSYRGAPNLNLALSMVEAGGGPQAFDAAKLVGVLAGPNTDAEVAKLNKQFGPDNVQSFLAVFTYSIDDVLRMITEKKIPLPADAVPDPKDGKALATALFVAGTMPDGKFDIGYMIEHVISHDLHVELMKDINDNPKFGPKANANFHTVLTQAMFDLKAAYGL